MNFKDMITEDNLIVFQTTFDSMTSDRPYRVASNIDYAVSELVKCSDTQFDERAVEAFLRAIKKGVLSPENEKALI